MIALAIAEWETHTCIKFEETAETNVPRIKFVKGSDCFSSVGRMPISGGQLLSIGDKCNKVNLIFYFK